MTSFNSTAPQVKWPGMGKDFLNQFIPVGNAPQNPHAAIDTLALADKFNSLKKPSYVKLRTLKALRPEMLSTISGQPAGRTRLSLASLNRLLRFQGKPELSEDPHSKIASKSRSNSASSGSKRQSWRQLPVQEMESWRNRGTGITV
jgi:hypothetical protein